MLGPGETILRLAVAAALGSLIGLERQRFDKAAGLRTHMLVAVGSALVMLVSAYGFDGVLSPGRVMLDPSRVAAQVVSGIGFLGAGAILQRKNSVHGLTTAAGVWAVAAIGLAAGGGLFLAASAATALMLVILAAVKPLEWRIGGLYRRQTLSLRVEAVAFSAAELGEILRGAGLPLDGLSLRQANGDGLQRVEVLVGTASDEAVLKLIERLRKAPGVREVGYGPRKSKAKDAAGVSPGL